MKNRIKKEKETFVKRKFLIFAMFLFAFSIGYAANGNEEFLKCNNFLEQKKIKRLRNIFLKH